MQDSLLIAVLVLVVAWVFVRQRNKKQETSTGDRRKASSPGDTTYHAVSIKYSEHCCDAAKAMTGRRFLASAAPRLPLQDCDSLDCRCVFSHHDDRRSGQDRRSPFAASGFGGGGTGTHEQERRHGKDRRHDDDDNDFY